METTLSEKLYETAVQLAPAGVHSPVRAFKAVGGSPLFFKKGVGAQLTDVDGNIYVDFCMCWGALALGHASPDVIGPMERQLQNGTHFGTPTEKDVELAQLILSALTPFDQIRFVNSGTEAVMTAIRLARGYTGRNKIVKIDGCYHGHMDPLLVSAGSGLMTQGISSSKGVTAGAIQDTLVVKYDSKESMLEAFNKHGNDIAAVIIEPILANSGLFEPSNDYMQFLRKITEDHGTLLIYDEVITGFRIGWGGAKAKFNIVPDIGTYGKIIGGGLPVGAVCAMKKIMDALAPVGGVYQAGTLSGNPLCMTAGAATLTALQKSKFYEKIENDLGPYLDKKIQNIKTNAPLYYKRVGSIFWLCPGQKGAPKDPDSISKEASEIFKSIYRKILAAGIYLSPSVYEVSFLSAAHNRKDIDKLAEALAKALNEI